MGRGEAGDSKNDATFGGLDGDDDDATFGPGSGSGTGMAMGMGTDGLDLADLSQATALFASRQQPNANAGASGSGGDAPTLAQAHGGVDRAGSQTILAALGIEASAQPQAHAHAPAPAPAPADHPAHDPESESDEPQWYYQDLNTEVQGPFRPSDMRQWLEGGYFREDLPIRHESAPPGVVVPLANAFPDA